MHTHFRHTHIHSATAFPRLPFHASAPTQARGITLHHVNKARHGAVQKAAWKGHDECLRWLLVAADGPRLTAQILLRDFDGRTVPDQIRDNGQHRTAAWLEELAERLGLAAAQDAPL